MKDSTFTVFRVKTDINIVIALYKLAKKENTSIHRFTDAIINEYMDIHDGDRKLTTYIGSSCSYPYNLQIRYGTYKRVVEMAKKYNTLKTTIFKTALDIWQMNHS